MKLHLRKILLLVVSIMINNMQASILSHQEQEFNLDAARARIRAQEHPVLPIDQQLQMLEQLNSFPLGRFLLRNKGLNGEWTSYVILHGPQKERLSELESWFLNKAPIVLATRERFSIFQREIQRRLHSQKTLASIPCGCMEDLITLNFTGLSDVHLTGIDLDPASITSAKVKVDSFRAVGSLPLPPLVSVVLTVEDAWSLPEAHTFDLITSNGLNIYEPDDERVVNLYKEFYKALKGGGILVTSFLTPSPTKDSQSPWKIDQVDPQDIVKQKILMSDIIGAKWTCFRTEDLTRQQLSQAGFKDIHVIYDSRGMFPTVIAEK